MPKVPAYEGYVAPTGGLEVRPTEEAFGSDIGRQVVRSGAALEKIGDQLFKGYERINQRESESRAKDAQLEAAIEVGDVNTWYYGLEGQAAKEAFPEYTEKIRGIREKHLSSLGDRPEAQRMFDREYTRRMGIDIVRGAQFAGAQSKKHRSQTNIAIVKNAEQNVFDDPEESRLATELDTVIQATDAENESLPKVEQDLRRREATSKLVESFIAGKAEKNLAEGRLMYEKYKDHIIPSRRQAIQNNILQISTARQSAIATENQNYGDLIRADIKSVSETGQGAPGITYRDVQTALGPAAAAKWQVERQIASDTWSVTHSMSTKPNAALDFIVLGLKNLSDTAHSREDREGFARVSPVYMNVKAHVEKLKELRRNDPALSIGDDPEVYRLQQAALKSNYAPADVQQLSAARISAQERAGIPEDAQSPMTADEAQPYVDQIYRAFAGRSAAAFNAVQDQIKQRYGPAYAEKALTYVVRAFSGKANLGRAGVAAMNTMRRGMRVSEEEASALDSADLTDAENSATGPRPSPSSVILGKGKKAAPKAAPPAITPPAPEEPLSVPQGMP